MVLTLAQSLLIAKEIRPRSSPVALSVFTEFQILLSANNVAFDKNQKSGYENQVQDKFLYCGLRSPPSLEGTLGLSDNTLSTLVRKDCILRSSYAKRMA